MADSDPAIIGVQSCGCITYANAAPDRLDKTDQKAIARIIREGGSVERTTVGEAKQRPHFLESECPHDPKGWEPDPYEDPDEKITLRKGYSGTSTVYKGGYRRLGQVKREAVGSGQWYATHGWFHHRELTADDGSATQSPANVSGPFRLRQEAVDYLAAPVEEKAAA
jgi:hypothetical protein